MFNADLHILIKTDALIKGLVVEQLVRGAEQCGIGQQGGLNWHKTGREIGKIAAEQIGPV